MLQKVKASLKEAEEKLVKAEVEIEVGKRHHRARHGLTEMMHVLASTVHMHICVGHHVCTNVCTCFVVQELRDNCKAAAAARQGAVAEKRQIEEALEQMSQKKCVMRLLLSFHFSLSF